MKKFILGLILTVIGFVLIISLSPNAKASAIEPTQNLDQTTASILQQGLSNLQTTLNKIKSDDENNLISDEKKGVIISSLAVIKISLSEIKSTLNSYSPIPPISTDTQTPAENYLVENNPSVDLKNLQQATSKLTIGVGTWLPIVIVIIIGIAVGGWFWKRSPKADRENKGQIKNQPAPVIQMGASQNELNLAAPKIDTQNQQSQN